MAVERPLKRPTTLGILERRVPALEDPARSKRAIYRIADPYFAFWFRFICTKRSDIARGLGQHLVDTHILPRLDDYMGGVFEEMAREHARNLAAKDAMKASRVERRRFSRDRHSGAYRQDYCQLRRLGEMEYAATRSEMLVNLERHAASLPGYSSSLPHLLYGRSGCRADLRRKKHVRCFSARDMYA